MRGVGIYLFDDVEVIDSRGRLRCAARFVPEANVVEDSRWVDEGRIITSAGISAGIEMCLHLVARIESEDLAAATAKQMDYRWLADA